MTQKLMTKKLVTRTTAIALLLFLMGFSSGCGGGAVSTGGLGVFSQKELPTETIVIDDLPANVRTFVEKETGKNVVKEVTRGVRTSDGKYFYTITYADQAEELTAIRYWHDGTFISRERIQ
jgi:hypothetical protein